jgi:hypothetical protein
VGEGRLSHAGGTDEEMFCSDGTESELGTKTASFTIVASIGERTEIDGTCRLQRAPSTRMSDCFLGQDMAHGISLKQHLYIPAYICSCMFAN